LFENITCKRRQLHGKQHFGQRVDYIYGISETKQIILNVYYCTTLAGKILTFSIAPIFIFKPMEAGAALVIQLPVQLHVILDWSGQFEPAQVLHQPTTAITALIVESLLTLVI